MLIEGRRRAIVEPGRTVTIGVRAAPSAPSEAQLLVAEPLRQPGGGG